MSSGKWDTGDMAAIDWAQSGNGTFNVGSNWVGGVVPGAGDIAVINDADTYGVTLNAAATLSGLVMDAPDAFLYLEENLTAPDPALEGGELRLEGGSITGTVVATGGTLALANDTDSTLNNVTWHGKLDAEFPKVNGKKHLPATLTVAGSLDLTGASGHGTALHRQHAYIAAIKSRQRYDDRGDDDRHQLDLCALFGADRQHTDRRPAPRKPALPARSRGSASGTRSPSPTRRPPRPASPGIRLRPRSTRAPP